MKYMRKINFSQKNQNPITYMQYKNSKSLENSIDNSNIQILQSKAASSDQRKKIFSQPIFTFPPLEEIAPTP